jgi:hypothetical protein
MKKNLLSSLLLFCTLFYSCKNEDLQLSPVEVSEKTIEFKGETVVWPEKVPIEFLDQTAEDFIAYLQSYTSKKARANQKLSLSLKETVDIIAPFRSKYPDLSIDKDLDNKDVKRILKDFPSIKTVHDIREKSDIVLTYYNALLKAETLPLLIEAATKKKKLRSTSSMSDMNPYESSIVWNHPLWALQYFQASQAALSLFSYFTDGTSGNATQHSTWNCFIIKGVINVGGSKNNAINYARETTSAHEWNSEGTDKLYSSHTAMDLHNNRAGRTWMEKNTGWVFWGFRRIPTEGEIINAMTSFTNSAGNWGNGAPDNIVNNGGGWDNLYDANTWWFPNEVYLVYIGN